MTEFAFRAERYVELSQNIKKNQLVIEKESDSGIFKGKGLCYLSGDILLTIDATIGSIFDTSNLISVLRIASIENTKKNLALMRLLHAHARTLVDGFQIILESGRVVLYNNNRILDFFMAGKPGSIHSDSSDLWTLFLNSENFKTWASELKKQRILLAGYNITAHERLALVSIFSDFECSVLEKMWKSGKEFWIIINNQGVVMSMSDTSKEKILASAWF